MISCEVPRCAWPDGASRDRGACEVVCRISPGGACWSCGRSLRVRCRYALGPDAGPIRTIAPWVIRVFSPRLRTSLRPKVRSEVYLSQASKGVTPWVSEFNLTSS
jgi:hypothetical protein